MKKPVAPTLDPTLLAVLHRAGRSWRVLVVATRDSGPAVVAARQFPFEQSDRIDAWLIEQQVGRVLCVLPASAVICRTVPLPNAAPEQLEPALRLQAEAHLLGIAPPHRLAMAVLPAAPGETTRSGLILAWPESADFSAPITSYHVRYVPDVAALAGLLNGSRPDDPAMWLDRGDGSVAIAVTHSAGAIFRATREEAGELEPWQRSVGRIVAETALTVGHTGGYVETAVTDARAKAASIATRDAALYLPGEVIASAAARLQGAGEDRKWWHEFGIAAGAALVASAELAPLATLQHTPPKERPSAIRSALESLSRPRTAAVVVAAALAILLLGPLAFAALRLAVVNIRYGDVADELEAAREAKAQLVVYRELDRQKTWPMTKLLSDLATNAPLGIKFDVIRIDGGKDFSISGTAIAHGGRSQTEVVSLMLEHLNADRVFTDLSLTWGDSNNLGIYKFDISGKVAKPYYAPPYPVERDFGLWTHTMRRDNEPPPTGPRAPTDTALASRNAASGGGASGSGATRSTLPSGQSIDIAVNDADADADEDSGEFDSDSGSAMVSAVPDGGSAGGGSRRLSTPSGSAVGDDPTTSGGGAVPAAAIPPPLTREAIEAMTLPQLQEALAAVSKARQYAQQDEAVKTRLKDEFQMIMDQMRKVRGST